jgi:threonine/homoserine/homoserine lactone efflux protein
MITVFFKALLVGFFIAAPVGPIAILCIRRTLEGGRFAGLFTGLGASVGDAFFGLIAGFGLNIVEDFMLDHRTLLKIIGSIVLLYLGINNILKARTNSVVVVSSGTLCYYFLSTLVLVITNPITILAFITLFAGLGLHSGVSYVDAMALVSGVFFGSMFWWFTLSELALLLVGKIKPRYFELVNRAAGILLIAFSIVLVGSVFV